MDKGGLTQCPFLLDHNNPSGHFFGIDDAIVITVAAAALKGAAVGAVAGAGLAAITGGDIGQGMLTGAISGAFFAGAGAYIGMAEAACTPLTTITQAAIHAGAGAASGAINASITGGNIGLGAVTGAVSAGFGKYVGVEYLAGEYWAVQYTGYAATGAFTGGIASVMYGGNFGDGMQNGFITASYGFWFNQMGIGEGVWKALVGGIRGANYALNSVAYEFQTNEQLHEGTIFGFKSAGQVVLLTKSAVFFKSVTIYLAPEVAQGVYQALQVNPEIVYGSIYFINSALPGVPVPNRAGVAGVITSKIYDVLSK